MKVLPKLKSLFLTIDRFLVVAFLYMIPQLIYCLQKYYWYDFELDPYAAAIIGITCVILIPFCLYSGVRLITVFNLPLREQYFALERRPKTLRERLIFFLQTPSLLVGSTVFALLHLTLPLHTIIMPVLDLIPNAGQSRPLQLLILAGYLPILFAVSLTARLTAMKYWHHHSESASSRKKSKFQEGLNGEYIRILLIYLLGGLGLCNGIPILISVFPLFRELLMNPFTAFILAVIVLGPLLYRPIRAIIKRRTFLKKLRRTCAQKGITLSQIDLPYRSIFGTSERESFSVIVNDKRYACKLLGAIKRSAPLVLFADGKGGFVHTVRFARVTLFTRITRFDYGFDAEGEKILIVNPVPKKICQGINGKSVPLDNGDTVGGCKVFTASGFLGALDRGCIER